ncbi:MAG: hypothetical protein QOJ57_1907 [Thermoleophilaceae bacterium]|nr:hypothetical protein [Thermoleophilaceae bacterium]
MGYHLAQLNVARFRLPMDDPAMAGFVEQLDPINALADATPGFVWRLQTEEGNATAIHAFEDDLMLVNMSVWESVEPLADFVYRSAHVEVMRRRREWAERMTEAYMVLWWVPTGTIPTVEEAKDRLAQLREHGPTPTAFTFKKRFSPDEAAVASPEDERDFCPA